MNISKQRALERELRGAGASAGEINELLALAGELHSLRQPHAANAMPAATRRPRWRMPTFAALAAVAVLIIVSAQSVLPNSWLFPVQAVTDKIAVALSPRHRATIMIKRADQVNALVLKHADDHAVLAALADYTSAADAYKAAPRADYTTFRYCQSELTQTATIATPTVRRAIQRSLSSLDLT